jgi:hypothetical protein
MKDVITPRMVRISALEPSVAFLEAWWADSSVVLKRDP